MKKIFALLLACIMLLILSGCTMPEYEYLGRDEEKGDMLNVDGIIYRTQPETLWRPSVDNPKRIGTVKIGKLESGIYTFACDVDKIFVMQKATGIGAEGIEIYYYKDGVNLPSFDVNGIDTIEFGLINENGYSNSIIDKKTIEKLFNIIGSVNEKDEAGLIPVYWMELTNNGFEGIGIGLPVYAKDVSYWIDVEYQHYNKQYNSYDEYNYYAEIPQDLLEEIAGEKLPTASEYLNSLEVTEGK